MAKFNFTLRNTSAKKPTPIILRASFNGKKIKSATTLLINPTEWNNESQRGIGGTKKIVSLNKRLNDLIGFANDTYNSFLATEKRVPTNIEFTTNFYKNAGLEITDTTTEQLTEPIKETLFTFIAKA